MPWKRVSTGFSLGLVLQMLPCQLSHLPSPPGLGKVGVLHFPHLLSGRQWGARGVLLTQVRATRWHLEEYSLCPETRGTTSAPEFGCSRLPGPEPWPAAQSLIQAPTALPMKSHAPPSYCHLPPPGSKENSVTFERSEGSPHQPGWVCQKSESARSPPPGLLPTARGLHISS